jgi:hypothetical protein
VDVGKNVSQVEYIFAFYTTALFRLERVILRLIASKPSTDDDALMLAQSKVDAFAAWRVEEREA